MLRDVEPKYHLSKYHHFMSNRGGKESSASWTGIGTAIGDELIIDNAPPDGFAQCLLLVNRQPRLAASQRVLGVGKVAVKLRGGAVQSGSVRNLGYVGSFLAEYAACLELRHLKPSELTGPMRAILEPKVDIAGDYTRRPLRAELVPVNASQRAAITGLQYALEKVQGPPGTGKSTTIFHILDARVPEGQRVLVTCSRNVAVESIAQKLEGLNGWPLCVFGPRDRVGDTARRNLLDDQVGGQFEERKLQRVGVLLETVLTGVNEAIERRECQILGCKGEVFLRAFLQRKYSCVYFARDICNKLQTYCAIVSVEPEWLKKQQVSSKQVVLNRSKVFLCTISSTSRLLREWEETMGDELSVHTVIVDECGCTPESSTTLLLRLRPKNLVLVGDHKQLPPCSVVMPTLLEGTGHTRSLLERCVLGSGKVHQLREQYRMHPIISNIVSRLFYNGRLSTPESVVQARVKEESRPLVWLEVQGQEEAPERSYINQAEVQVAVKACARAREVAGKSASIAVLTFYRGQLQALMQAIPYDLGVEVLTVDACQGSEFDYVVLSTVRANHERRLGFVKDKQRINVAISRARLKLLIVGNAFTLTGDEDWVQIFKACQTALPEEQRPRAVVTDTSAGGYSVLDALRAEKKREFELKVASAIDEQAYAKKGQGKHGGKQSGSSVEALMVRQSCFMSRTKSARDGSYGQSNGFARLVRNNDGTFRSTAFAAVIGGGHRRADMESLEAIARHHLTSLEVDPTLRYQPKYCQPASVNEYAQRFPELEAALAIASHGHEDTSRRAPRGDLRPFSLNDLRKQRRALGVAQSAPRAQVDLQPVDVRGSVLEKDVALESYRDETEQFEQVPEAVLFEMFPDEVSAVEEALLRFAGLPHATNRALEALLARTTVVGDKGVLDVEDELDYDCALEIGSADDVDGDDESGFWNAIDASQDLDNHYDDDMCVGDKVGGSGKVKVGWCEACGERTEGHCDEDDLHYCVSCWEKWDSWETEPSQAAQDSEAQVVAVKSTTTGTLVVKERPPPPPIPIGACGAQRWKSRAEGNNSSAPRNDLLSAPVSETPPPVVPRPSQVSKLSKQPEKSLFFMSLDGAPKWSEAPARPEAGGKELVLLKPKEERGENLGNGRSAGSKGRWSGDVVPIGVLPPKVTAAPTVRESCRKLLASIQTEDGELLEGQLIDYIAGLVEDDISDDTKEEVLGQLEAHGVVRSKAEVFWEGLVT